MTAFNRNFGGSSSGSGGNHNNGGDGDGSGCGCLIAIGSGRGADSDRLGWLNQSLQVKHRFSLRGFFESACRKRRSMIA